MLGHGSPAQEGDEDVDAAAAAAFGEALDTTTALHIEVCSAHRASLNNSNQAIQVQASAVASAVAFEVAFEVAC